MPKAPKITVYPEQTQEVRFPLAGIDLTMGFGRQPNYKTSLDYARTTIYARNVRAFEPGTGRGRGGSRPGLSDYIEGPVAGVNQHVQELQAVTATWWFPGNSETGEGGLGTIPGSEALLAVFAVDGVTISSQARVVWNVPASEATGKSYSVAALLIDDTGVVAGTVNGQEAVLMIDGQEAYARTPIAGMATDRNALTTAVIGGEDLYFFGIASDGKLVGSAIHFDNSVTWTQANIGPTNELGTDDADPAFACTALDTAYLNLINTGIVQVDLATGAALTPFLLCSNADLTTAAGNRYRNAGQCATNSLPDTPGKIAVLMATEDSPAKYAVVYVDADTGAATAVLSDLLTVDLTYPWADFSGETYLQSDGTDFYFMRYQFERNADDGQKYSRVLKLHGTTGAILHTSQDLAVAMKSIGYSTANQDVYVSSAYGLQAAALNVFGGGITPSFHSFYDCGSFSSAGLFANGADPSNANNYNRAVALIGVAGGTVKVAYNGLWFDTTNGSAALNVDMKVIRSTVLEGRVYFVDTEHWKLYDAQSNTVESWTASFGSLPVDDRNNLPRLICTWRGRIVLSGLPMDGNNVFMSAVGDAQDWEYAPQSPSATDAVALNASELGKVGDVVTCLIPYSDDVLLIGGDHSIWMLRGDPLYGGQLDNVTNSIGMAWGNPWCRDPGGTVYFMSSQCQIYTLRPGEKPVQISLRIQQLLNKINLDSVVVRLGWNEGANGVHVFVTMFGRAQPSLHYFYETRTQSWFTDQFGNSSMNPLCILQFYGSTIRDRALLIGSWDGTVRQINDDAPTDDGTDIESDVFFGPLTSTDFNELLMTEMQLIAGKDVSSIKWSVYRGRTAEEAYASQSFANGVWEADQSTTEPVRCAGHALYVRLSSNRYWAIEAIRVKMGSVGEARRRAY